MPEYVLALDQGTTSSRAILFDDQARTVAASQKEFEQVYPQPGWVEHDPAAIWESQLETARRVLADSGVLASDVAAIGIANQRETTVLWERATGRPIASAIVWQDRRTADVCERLRAEGVEPLVTAKTGLLLDPYFSATKIAWLLDHAPAARQRAERGELAFGTVDSYLLWRLTGGRVHATDVTNASRTLLMDLHTLAWNDELLAIFRIPRALLPNIHPSSGFLGETATDLFGAPIPICGIVGDQQAAMFGQACLVPGMVKNTYGTGSFLLMNIGDTPHPSRNRLLTTIAWQLERDPGKSRIEKTSYALEGSVFVTGAAVQWLRDELGIVKAAAETESLADSVPDSAGVYFVPAFVGLGAPHWDSAARGAIFGLTRGATRAHLARAVLEAACFQTRDIIEAMQADCGVPLADLRVDGGMTANNALLQIQADTLGIPVHRPGVMETTALGAAYMAGLAVGIWQDTDQIAAKWRIDRTFEPRVSVDRRESFYADWKRAVTAARSF